MPMNKKKTVMIVDDSELNRAILSSIISHRYEIVEAANGEEAIKIMENRNDISLVLLDIVMDKMDGFEVLTIMNMRNWLINMPVIIISSETSSAYIKQAYELGATDYISRPFDYEIVLRRVENTIMLYSRQKILQDMVSEQIFDKERNNRLMVEILSNIVEFRNGESGLHVLHIRQLTKMLLTELVRSGYYELNDEDINLISTASALHDIGKIAIDEKILNKPGRLTPEEFEVMKQHSVAGSDMLEKVPFGENEPLIKVAHDICRWHHERYDGRGYPDGLKGDEIPISAQVVSVADVYDALTSERVYKKAFSHEKAIQMILNGECGQFNPKILECFMNIAKSVEQELATEYEDTTSMTYIEAEHLMHGILIRRLEESQEYAKEKKK